jgi:hypothetical protein
MHIARPKFLTPLANGFIRHRDSTFREECFDFTDAQTQSMIEPDGVADDFREKAMALAVGCFGCQTAQSAKWEFN